MRTTLWWIYWAIYQALSLVYAAIGVVILLPLALTRSWYVRKSTAQQFVGRDVTSWKDGPHALVAVLSCFAALAFIDDFGLKALVILALITGYTERIYDNEEHGVVPPAENNGAPYLAKWPDAIRAYIWSAWRNPANNMRLLPGASITIDSKELSITKKPWGYYAVASGRPCLAIKGLRIGWLINLDAATGWRSWPVLENTKQVNV